MAAELVKIYPDNPDMRKIRHVAQALREGALVIYPTDTVYGLGCDLMNIKAIERVCQLKGIKPQKSNLSFICYDLSHISEYTGVISTPVFKVMKKALPGPFTFILPSSSRVPKLLQNNKKTVGIRVPDNAIPRELVKELGNPIITTSIHDEDEVIEYSTDPELIHEKYYNKVDIVIDGGYGQNVPSTVVSCLNDTFEVVREGLGDIYPYL
ncbi:L-threonylcarbamoyladenylate synthase [Cytophagales bacterium LB-30]|uniref:L-threonylcarbamoyladenylate synthase n=1 Tax=Shiella aurantiaca TaxID=3058365 RepID=A0ABT8F7A4_9BACT|nr:L-threonylcarbamoyladenylate synthase [Shiella aurantiaca]MDN4166357.1 L-threonylcarbamoyladenylate synthase [Shiella aurantiaca]